MWPVFGEADEGTDGNTHWVGLAGQGALLSSYRQSQANVLERKMRVTMGRELGAWRAAVSRSSLGKELQPHRLRHPHRHRLS